MAAVVLPRHHQQRRKDEDVLDREAAQVLWLLDTLARLLYDHCARLTLLMVQFGFTCVLSATKWPAGKTRDSL